AFLFAKNGTEHVDDSPPSAANSKLLCRFAQGCGLALREIASKQHAFQCGERSVNKAEKSHTSVTRLYSSGSHLLDWRKTNAIARSKQCARLRRRATDTGGCSCDNNNAFFHR